MRKRISVRDMAVEKKMVTQFFLDAGLLSGWYSTEELYKKFKQSRWTKLTLNGFGRLLPKHFKRAVRRIDSKLYRGVIL